MKTTNAALREFHTKVTSEGFEPSTSASVVRCSIQLSYEAICLDLKDVFYLISHLKRLQR